MQTMHTRRLQTCLQSAHGITHAAPSLLPSDLKTGTSLYTYTTFATILAPYSSRHHHTVFVCCHKRPGHSHWASPATPSLDSLRQTTLVQLQELIWLWGWRRQHRPLFKRVALRNMTRGGVTRAYNDKNLKLPAP